MIDLGRQHAQWSYGDCEQQLVYGLTGIAEEESNLKPWRLKPRRESFSTRWAVYFQGLMVM